MTTWFAQNSSVNIDSVNQWNDAANGSGNWLTWASLGASDVLVANGKTSITINVNVTCATLTTAATGGTAGGGFILSAGITVTANITGGTTTCITTSFASPLIAYIVGNITSATGLGVSQTSSGDLTITGNVTNGGASAAGITQSGTGTLNVIGNVTGGPQSSGNTSAISQTSTGIINVTGNVSGSTTATSNYCVGINTSSSGQVNVTGNVNGGTAGYDTLGIGGSYGIWATGAANVSVTGVVTGGTGTLFGVYLSTATSRLTITGSAVSSGTTAAVYLASHVGRVILNGDITCGANGNFPFGGILWISSSITQTHTYRTNNGGVVGLARSLYTGGINVGHPAIADVRSGTTFGAASEYTGTLAVPSPTLVAIGVPTDNTVGSYEPGGGASAADIADAVWDEVRSGHTTSGTFGATSQWVSSGDTSGVTELLTRIPDAAPGAEGGLPVLDADLAVTAVLDSDAQAMVTAFNAMRSGNVFTAPALANAPSGGSGLTGPFTRTITVTDAADDSPIEAAKVRLYRTGETETKPTEADGEVSFTTEAATFSYAVTAVGYGGASGTIVISANGATTIELTATSVTPPTNPDLSAVVVSCLGTDFEPEAGVTIDLRIKTLPSGSTNTAYPGMKQTATSNGSGIATLEAPKGSVCEWKRGREDSWTEITIGSDDQTNVTSIIGSRY